MPSTMAQLSGLPAELFLLICSFLNDSELSEFLSACRINRGVLFDSLCERSCTHHGSTYERCLLCSAELGNVELMTRALESDGRADDGADGRADDGADGRADVNLYDHSTGQPPTPIHAAVKSGRPEAVEFLLNKGAHLERDRWVRTDHGNCSPVTYPLGTALLYCACPRYDYCFSATCQIRVQRLVPILIAHGARLAAPSRPALPAMVRHLGQEHVVQCVRQFLQKNPDVDLNERDQWSYPQKNALEEAASRGDRELFRLLLHQPRIDIFRQSPHGHDALTYALGSRNWDIIVDLLSYSSGSKPYGISRKKEIFQLAIKDDEVQLVRYLMANHGMSRLTRFRSGMTALDVARNSQATECLEAFHVEKIKGPKERFRPCVRFPKSRHNTQTPKHSPDDETTKNPSISWMQAALLPCAGLFKGASTDRRHFYAKLPSL